MKKKKYDAFEIVWNGDNVLLVLDFIELLGDDYFCEFKDGELYVNQSIVAVGCKLLFMPKINTFVILDTN